MTSPQEVLKSFVAAVRRRLLLRRLWSLGVVAFGAAFGVVLLAALLRVAFGYAAEPWWYAAAAGGAVVATLVGWLCVLPRVDESAQHADAAFGLQDGLISWLHFVGKGRQAGFYALQAKQTAQKLEGLDPKSVGVVPRRNRWITALCLVAVAGALGFVKPSDAVLLRQAQEEFTLAETARINEELEKELEELTRDLDDEEHELVDPDKLREQIDAFEETSEPKAALRQYAKLEQMLQKQVAKLNQRRDEELAAKAAAELDKAPQTRKLAKPLQQKQYEKTAEQLSQMAPQKTAKLSEQQKQAARLRAASQRMAAAARSRRNASGSSGAGSAGQPGGASSSSGSQGSNGSAAGGAGSSGGELGGAMLDLDAAVAKLEDALREALDQEKRLGKCDSQCQSRCESCLSKCDSSLSNLSRCLSKMGVKKRASSRLSKLCKACSQCQGGLCKSQSNSLCQSPNAGGRNAGAGSVESRRDPTDEALAAGSTERLSGIKGDGPSQTSIESADDGSGVSSRQATAKRREFRRSAESFVNREDIPASVRRGVKRYFESIHDLPPTATNPGEKDSL